MIGTAWLAKIVGPKLAKPVLIGGGILLLLGLVFLLGRCTGDDSDAVEAQAKQTTRSSEALADAAEGAIDILEDRTATEDAIDQIVAQTVEDIDGAQSATDVRNAVIQGVCSQPSHRNDPACTTHAENRP